MIASNICSGLSNIGKSVIWVAENFGSWFKNFTEQNFQVRSKP